jgi:hypothetical protein
VALKETSTIVGIASEGICTIEVAYFSRAAWMKHQTAVNVIAVCQLLVGAARFFLYRLGIPNDMRLKIRK